MCTCRQDYNHCRKPFSRISTSCQPFALATSAHSPPPLSLSRHRSSTPPHTSARYLLHQQHQLTKRLQPMMASSAPKGWTDTEKVSFSTTRGIRSAPFAYTLQASLFLQIIAKAGPVPWPELTLPEGRTVKACQVMLDKEKQKIKKAREAAGEDVNADVTSPKVSLSIFTYAYIH
jgi:hypothetical protein